MREEARAWLGGLGLTFALVLGGFAAWSWPLPARLFTHTLVQSAASRALDTSPGVRGTDWSLILANDQNLSLWNTVENARTIARGDWRGLLSQGQCYPMPLASTLGEHMIESGVLAAPWWLVTHDPVASYNLALLSALVVAALGMYLFVYLHASSVPAAVAGAIAFAFATPRLVDLPHHPAVVGTHWIPWVLWSFDLLLASGSVLAAAVFAVTLLLASLVGSYPLMAVGILGGAYGIVRILDKWRNGGLRISTLSLLVAATLPALFAVAGIVSTYARVQHEWLLVSHPDAKFLVGAADYLPGGLLPVGSMALLGLIPLVLMRREAGRRAVPALAVATVLAFVLTTRLGGASLYEMLAQRLPVLDSVRAPGKVGLAVAFGVQALGAIGWSRLMHSLGSGVALAIAAVLVAMTIVETSTPPAARGLIGAGAEMELRAVAPPAARIDALRNALGDARDRRAVLDLPTGRMVRAPAALLDAAYHGHPTSACYNSLVPPTLRAVYAMADAAHTVDDVAALAAAGFGFVIERSTPQAARLSTTSFPPPARLLVYEPGISIWGLPHPSVLRQETSDLGLVVTGGATRGDTFAPEPPYELDLGVTNKTKDVWAARRPVAPFFADVEIAAATGEIVLRTQARGVLPLALAPGETVTTQLVMPAAPPAGEYRVTVRTSDGAALAVDPQFRWLAPSVPDGAHAVAEPAAAAPVGAPAPASR